MITTDPNSADTPLEIIKSGLLDLTIHKAENLEKCDIFGKGQQQGTTKADSSNSQLPNNKGTLSSIVDIAAALSTRIAAAILVILIWQGAGMLGDLTMIRQLIRFVPQSRKCVIHLKYQKTPFLVFYAIFWRYNYKEIQLMRFFHPRPCQNLFVGFFSTRQDFHHNNYLKQELGLSSGPGAIFLLTMHLAFVTMSTIVHSLLPMA